MEIFIKNLKVNYIKKGTGKNVLIIPGWGATIETYNALIESISTYANVYCLDIPGFGKSQEPDYAWCLDDYTKFIIEFIEKQNIKELDLIGHSNGGRIIIRLATIENLNFKINKIILIGGAGIVHKKKLLQKIKIYSFKLCKKIVKVKCIEKRFPNLLERVQKIFGSDDYKNATPILRQSLVKLVNEDVRNLLPKIKVPVLLIWGEKDDVTPLSDAEIMEKLIPDSGIVNIRGGSHYVFLENPSYVNKIINTFLNGGN